MKPQNTNEFLKFCKTGSIIFKEPPGSREASGARFAPADLERLTSELQLSKAAFRRHV